MPALTDPAAGAPDAEIIETVPPELNAAAAASESTAAVELRRTVRWKKVGLATGELLLGAILFPVGVVMLAPPSASDHADDDLWTGSFIALAITTLASAQCLRG